MARLRSLLLILSLACGAAFAAVAYDLPSVMQGILKVESGGSPYPIMDNTTRRSYSFSSRSEAERMAQYLLSLNHNIDMGLYQINSIHLSRGWKVSSLFDATFNRTAAETIFNEWLAQAKKIYGDAGLAWERSIAAYNAGFPGLQNGNPLYVNKVLRAMGAQGQATDTAFQSQAATSTQRLPKGLDGDDTDDGDDLDAADGSDSAGRGSSDATDAAGDLLGGAVSALTIIVALAVCAKAIGLPLARLILGRLLGSAWSASRKSTSTGRG